MNNNVMQQSDSTLSAESPPIRKAVFSANIGWAVTTLAALAINMLIDGYIFVGFLTYWQSTHETHGDPILLTQGYSGPLPITLFVLYLLPRICWSFWIFRAYRNISSLGHRQNAFTAHAAWIWYWIPIANLWLPFRYMTETWRKSSASVSPNRSDVPIYVKGWWAMWITALLLGSANFVITQFEPMQVSPQIMVPALAFDSAFRLIADFLGMFVIIGLQRRQRRALSLHQALLG